MDKTAIEPIWLTALQTVPPTEHNYHLREHETVLAAKCPFCAKENEFITNWLEEQPPLVLRQGDKLIYIESIGSGESIRPFGILCRHMDNLHYMDAGNGTRWAISWKDSPSPF